MSFNRFSSLKFLLALFLLAGVSCKESKSKKIENPKVDKLKLPAGFEAEHLYSPGDNDQGSWVSMAFDDKGRLIVSDQYGGLYRLTLAPIGADSLKPKIEKLNFDQNNIQGRDTTKPKVTMGCAQGLLWAFNSLYVMVNHNPNDDFPNGSGLYRLQDTDGDDQFDKITLLKALEGEGEHGPHSVVLAPDKQSIYVIAGNHTNMPKMDAYRLPAVWDQDNLFPLIKDPNGHANDRHAPGGWIANVDSTGTRWELISAGYRNPFDIAFNDQGDMFTYDSDMEWDFGMPWYRPTRICHVTSGSEFGWRTGNSKWTPQNPDNLPAIVNIGQGSPTNLIYAKNALFPEKYRNGLLAFDWSFGIIYSIQLTPEGSSYKAQAEEFISGSPLPLTDGVIGPDGALYFLTGGRRLESDLYRVYYGDQKKIAATPSKPAEENEEHKIRKQLEQFHGAPDSKAVDIAWPYLKHSDRFIRYAARVAVEHQPVSQWQQKALDEKDPEIIIESSIALSHQGAKNLKSGMFSHLMAVDYDQLSEDRKFDLLRAFELILTRMGKPEGAQNQQVIAYLNPKYPASKNSLNRQLSKLLVYMDAPQAVEKTLALMEKPEDKNTEQTTATESSNLIMRNPQYGLDIAGMLAKMPPAQQVYYATVLSEAKNGWTPEKSEEYFKWFNNAFNFKGGVSYVGFIDKARKMALANVSKDKFVHYDTLSGSTLLNKSGTRLVEAVSPKGPGRRWKIEEAVLVVDSNLGTRNFEQGRQMFTATLCSSCHAMKGEGGAIGPDLTQLGTRFSNKDILEAIIDPNKVISDQYAATVFTLKDGSSIVGRKTNEDKDKYFVAQNPFAPQALKEILKKDVVSIKNSEVSIMLPGLINRLNPEELKDLLAYLKAGGDPNNEVFSNITPASSKK